MLEILSAIRSQPTRHHYQELMLEFLSGIVEGVRKNPDPKKEGWKYHCLEEIFLEYGQFMEGKQAQQIGMPRRCYQNCLSVIFNPENSQDLIYVEGYALSDSTHLYPLEHAWVLLNEQVIDVTWDELSPCYFGIPFQRKWVIEKTEEKQLSGDPKINFLNYQSPLTIKILKNGLPSEAVINY